jgi:diketogulonate reductase-like aldo/keto reductase
MVLWRVNRLMAAHGCAVPVRHAQERFQQDRTLAMIDRLATRREVLRVSAAAGCAGLSAALPVLDHAAAQPGGTMLTREIPQTREKLPIVGIGTWQTFDVGAERSALDQRKEVLRVLFEAGGRVIDSSPMYGRAEAVVGTLLTEMKARDKAFLATKVWTTGQAAGVAQMEASFAKMQAKTIDLMQIHNLVDWKTHLGTLRAWKESKRYRYIGITHYTVPSLEELAAVIRAERTDFVQLAYSINVREADARLLPLAAERGVAVIINQPFDSGALFQQVRGKPLPAWAPEVGCASWGQYFLKFILGHPAVTCVIPGTARPDHARDNIGAGFGPLPDAAQRKRMADHWQAL